MLGVFEEVVSGMSISFIGHNVKMNLSYLDMSAAQQQQVADSVVAKTTAALQG